MSGAEALAVASVIAAIIDLVDFSSKVIERIGDFSKNVSDVPESFRGLQTELPLLGITLRRTTIRVDSGQLDEETCKAIRPSVLACEQKLASLKTILEKVVPKDGASKIEVIWKAIRSLSKDKEVEKIAASVASYMRAFTLYYAEAGALSSAERTLLTESISKMSVNEATAKSSKYTVSFDLTGVPVTGGFIGRTKDLELLKKILSSDSGMIRRQFCVIHGLGGLGKTQLAIEFARLNKQMYSSVFWLEGMTEQSLVDSIIGIEKRTQGEGRDTTSEQAMPFAELKARALKVLEWFSLPGNDKWLLIYDNVDKTSFNAPENDEESLSAYNVAEYFPSGDVGSIIITTRLQRLAVLGGSLKLQKLDRHESLAVLEQNSRKRLAEPLNASVVEGLVFLQQNAPSDVNELIQKLDGLPLALVLAGRYIAKTTVAKYLQLYNRSWKELHASISKLHDYPHRTIITTWMISYRSLLQVSKPAGKLLNLWACLYPRDLWYELLCWPTDRLWMPEWLQQITDSEIAFLDIMDLLLGESLIEQAENLNSYAMHPVFHEWMQSCQTEETIDEHIITSIICVGSCIPSRNDEDFWILQKRLIPHADCLLKQLYRTGDSILLDSQQHELVMLQRLRNLGDLYSDQCRMELAGKIYDQTLIRCEKKLGPDHPLTIQTVGSLGTLYSARGKLSEAEQMYERALAGFETSLGPHHSLKPNAASNMGVLYETQKRWTEAEQLYMRVLASKEKGVEPNDMLILDTLSNLGDMYNVQGKLAQSEQMQKQALEGYELSLGPHHPSTLLTVNNLGLLYKNQERLAEAEQMYERALTGQEKKLGVDHVSTLATVLNLGNLYKDQGKLTEAEQLCDRAIAGYTKALGSDHESTIDAIDTMGQVYFEQGRLVEAEQMHLQALKIYESSIGSDQKSMFKVLGNLGDVYKEQGRLSEAEEMYKQALACHASDYLSMAVEFQKLGILYERQDRLTEAEQMLDQARTIREKELGPDHISTITTVYSFGEFYKRQGRVAESEQMCKRALAAYDKLLGPTHPSSFSAVLGLAYTYEEQGRLAEAEQMYAEALARKEKTLGPNHTITMDTVYSLGNLYEVQGKTLLAKSMFERLERDGSHCVTCDTCDVEISCSGTYYHCSVCSNNNFDLCEQCVPDDGFCSDIKHRLTKRSMEKGAYTVTLSPWD